MKAEELRKMRCRKEEEMDESDNILLCGYPQFSSNLLGI